MRSNQLSANNLDGLGIFALMAKALTLAPPQAEPRERPGSDTDPAPIDAPTRRRGLLERLDHWFWRQQQRGVEAYLAQSADVFDLEARMRALQRNVPYPYY